MILIFFVQVSSAEKLNFTADNALKKEIASQTFQIDGHRRIYAFIPSGKYDFAKVEVRLRTTGNISGTAFLVMGSHYTNQTSLRSELEFFQQPSEFRKRRIEFQINGKGQLKIEKAEVIMIVPDYRFDAEYYNVYLFIRSLDANRGFKGDMEIYSKKSFSTLSYTLNLSYFGMEIFRESKSLTSKNKFARGKLSDIRLEIPARFFIIPGIYTLEVSSKGWKFERSIVIWPGIWSIAAIALIASTIYGGVKYRKEIGRWLNSLSTGQKLVLVAIILLIFAAVTLAFESERNANSISILAYYFLLLGVGNLTAEYLLERREGGEKCERGDEVFDPYPETRAVISFLTLAALTHFSPTLLRTFPYLDAAALTSALFLTVLSVKERSQRKTS